MAIVSGPENVDVKLDFMEIIVNVAYLFLDVNMEHAEFHLNASVKRVGMAFFALNVCF